MQAAITINHASPRQTLNDHMDTKKKIAVKKGISADAGRRRRGESAIQLRKAHKEEGLAKRRHIVEETPAAAVESLSSPEPKASVADIPALCAQLQSPDVALQLSSMKSFRRLLSVEKNPPVQECLKSGAIALFITSLQRFDSPELQFEAAWSLTNIASTEHTALVARMGAVPHLVKLLTSNMPDVREQCAWCLGNIAGDGPELRDMVLGCGALAPLIANIAEPASLSLLRNCTWSLSNFCRGKPQPNLESIFPAVQALCMLLKATSDVETMADVAWALSYVSDGSNERIESVVSQGVITNLIQLLSSGRPELIIPSLRTLGNIVTGSDAQTQAVLDTDGALASIIQVMGHSKKNIRKEACWLLSNIAAGSKTQIAQLVNTPGLILSVLSQLSESSEWDVRKEASWVICNIASGGAKEHIHRLVENGALQPLCDLLGVGEARVLILALEALDNILQAGLSSSVDYVQLVDEVDGISKLELLQEHENNEVYEKAVSIIEKYFSGEEDEGDSENMAPSVNGNTFSFGVAGQNGGNVLSVFKQSAENGKTPTSNHVFSNTNFGVFNFSA